MHDVITVFFLKKFDNNNDNSNNNNNNKNITNIMDLSHIFYKEIPTNGNNIFFAKLAESNGLLLKIDQNYMVTGLPRNQKAETDEIILI